MEITYKLDADDVTAWARYYLNGGENKVGKKRFRSWLPTFGLAVAFYLFKFWGAWRLTGYSLLYLRYPILVWWLIHGGRVILGATLLALLLDWIQSAAHPKSSRQRRPSASWVTKKAMVLLGLENKEMRVRLTQNGLLSREADSETIVYWRKFQNIVNAANHIFFVLNDKDDKGAMIIPKRAFENPVQADEFFHQAIVLWRSAGGRPPQSSPIPAPS